MKIKSYLFFATVIAMALLVVTSCSDVTSELEENPLKSELEENVQDVQTKKGVNQRSKKLIVIPPGKEGIPNVPPPDVTDYYPLSGPDGMTLNVTGNNFSSKPLNNVWGVKRYSLIYRGGVAANMVDMNIVNSSHLTANLPGITKWGFHGKEISVEIASDWNAPMQASTKGTYTITPTNPAPSWKILCLIVTNLDYTYNDPLHNDIERHVVGTMSAADQQTAETQFNTFITKDVPKLTSGMMCPTGNVKRITVSHTWTDDEITDADSARNLVPSRDFLGNNDDETYDAIILIFPATGRDQNNNNEVITFSNHGGQTTNYGKGRVYATFHTNRLSANDRNTFIHEFGHGITFYYFAMTGGDNKSCLGEYVTINNVHLFNHTGGSADKFTYWDYKRQKAYNIRTNNSNYNDNINNLGALYNNEYSFSHDYYSGFTADIRAKNTPIGIGQAQWNLGGPVTKP